MNDGAELAAALDNPPAAVTPADLRANANLIQLRAALRQFVVEGH